jgi:hypothetical protein
MMPEGTVQLEIPKVRSPRAGKLVSVVVLVGGRPEPLAELYQELVEVVRSDCENFEFIFVVDQTFFSLTESLAELRARGEPIRIVPAGMRVDETALLRGGVLAARGSIVLTLPARRRVETGALVKLLTAVRAGADVAVARRWPRSDSWASQIRSRLFHALVGRAVGSTVSPVSDLTSGVRAMRREVFDRLPLYGQSARFLPLLAVRDGYTVREIRVSQHASDKGGGFNSPVTYLKSLFDVLSLFFMLRFTEKPLRFFGLVGATALLPGMAISAVVLVQRLLGQPMAGRPLFLLGVLLSVLGVQMIALGLIGEIIVHFNVAQRVSYRLKDAQSSTDADDAHSSAGAP